MITLLPTDDMGLVKFIAAHHDIWARFSDGVNLEDYEPENDNRTQWLVIKSDDETAGIIRVYCESTCAIEFHPYMFKPYRKYVREMTTAFFQWFLNNTPESIIKVNIMTPECYQSVINASRKMGFIREGINRDSYRLNNKVYNQIMSGITKAEVKLCLA